jgi:hypothetical protein
MRSRLRAAILVLAASAGATSAQELSPLGLERPFLAGDFYSRIPITLDLGGDGITDLVVSMDGLLYGEQRIPIGDPPSLQTIVRGADGRWRHAQSFPALDGFEPFETSTKGDVDGDGSDDVVVSTIRGPYEWGDELLFGIDFLRQDPLGELHRGGAATLDSTVRTYSGVHILGDGSGRVLVATPTRLGDGGSTIEGTMLRWRAGAGWTQQWRAVVDTHLDYDVDGGGAVLLGNGDPLLISYTYDYGYLPHWGLAIPLRADGWGRPASFAVPRSGRFFGLDRNGERQVWLWTAEEPDSLYQIVRVAGTDSVLAHAIAIEGWNAENYFIPVDAAVAPNGDTYFLASESHNRAAIVRLSPDGTARILGRCVAAGVPAKLVFAPDGAIEILWSDDHQYLVLEPHLQEDLRPILPMTIDEFVASADFDRDQRLDIIVEGAIGGVRAEWLLRGMDRPPWFRAPEPITPRETGPWRLYESFLGDFDGDGRADLIQIIRGDFGSETRLILDCRFWDGWRFGSDSASRADATGFHEWLTGDFDGDGLDEILVRAGDYLRPRYLVLQWNRDRTPAAPVDLGNPFPTYVSLWRAGDVDGDGCDEVIVTRDRGFSLWSIDPGTARARALASWAYSQGFTGGGLADLSMDGAEDLYWFGWYESWIWSSGETEPPFSERKSIPFAPCAGRFSAIDVDVDGRLDLVGDGDYGFIEVITDPLGNPGYSAWVLPEHVRATDPVGGGPVVWADVDRDGDPDVVTVYEDGIRVHMNETLQPPVPGDAQPMIRFTGRNPARGEASVAVHADRAGEITLELFDVTGRRVWKERRDARAEGWIEVSIRPRVGRAEGPSGVYFLRAEVSGRVETQRIVLGF